MTSHAVVLLYQPPAFLNIASIVERPVLVGDGKRAFLTAHQKGGERADLILWPRCRLGMRSFSASALILPLSQIRLSELVFEEAFVVVPRPA